MLELPQITLCALGSEPYKESQQQALDYSCRGIKFGAVKNIILPTYNINDWNHAIIYDLPKYIDTDYCLLIHPDGYIIHPELWQDDWLTWDFIGAPWPLPVDSYSYRTPSNRLIRVGNSVSLRSKKLIDLVATRPMEFHYGNNNEDGQICVWERDWLEAQGCKFAPLSVAKYFSRELDLPENADVDQPFAFHLSNDKQKEGRNKQYPIFEKGKI